MPRTRITRIPCGDSRDEERVQYRTTVPRAVVDLLDLDGECVEWRVTDGSTVELRPSSED
jgi:hypothetical protein